MRVTDLARRAQTTAETVRHYTDIGLLTPRRNPDNGYRRYTERDYRRLGFALKARYLGFTLPDILELVQTSEAGDVPCGQARALIEARLREVEQRISELQALSTRMRQAVSDWQQAPDCRLEDGRVCGLIDSFMAGASLQSEPEAAGT